jgi:Ethanolamine utilization protein EutJ (predicted chaperonin)
VGIFFEKEITTQDRLIHKKNQIWTLVFPIKTYMNEIIYVMINKSSIKSLHIMKMMN